MTITFASFLTPEGLVIAAGLVTGFVELVRQAVVDFPPRRAVFALTGVLYILTGIAVGVPSMDAGLGIFIAWLGCATSAVGIKSAVSHAVEAKQPPTPPEPELDDDPDNG